MGSLISSIVLLGCITSSGKGDTFGTGFIVEYKNQFFIISCKHVYLELTNKNSIFAIPNPKQTLSPQNSYSVLQLGKSYFHPDDDETKTYDLVAFKILNVSQDVFSQIGITPIILTNNTISSSYNSNHIFAAGYPVDYVKSLLSNNKEDYMPPKIVKGSNKDIPLESLSLHGFNGKLIEGNFIEILDGGYLGKGCSGGLVYTIDSLNCSVPIGLIFGEGDIEITSTNKVKEKIHCIAYASNKRILEILTNID